MPNLRKYSLTSLNYYKSLGVDVHVQNKPRVRLNSENLSRSEEKKEITLNKLNILKENLLSLESELKFNAKQIVFSDGNPFSNIMIIGEAPGFEEDNLGLPFVGAAGKKLDKMFSAISLNRKKNIYITNIVPWRPPNNRTPTDNEIAFFLPYIEKHISIIKPKILLLMGNVATKAILNLQNGITKNRGKWFDYKNSNLNFKIFTMCIFHPSYLLRSPSQKKYAWKDLKKVKEKIVDLQIKI